MRALRYPFFLLPLALMTLSSACGDSASNPDSSVITCASDEDCPTGRFCQNGICVLASQKCDDGGTCPEGMVCVDDYCLPESDGGLDGGDGSDGDADTDGDSSPEPDIEIVDPPVSEGIHQLNFGNVTIGVTVTKQVKIKNDGDAQLQILQLNLEMGTEVEDFSIPAETLDSLPVNVAPGEQVSFDVQYTASDGLTDHGVLDIISNDPDEALVKIQLLSEFKGNARVVVSPLALPFGDIPVGQLSNPLSVTVSNQGTGNAVLTVDDIRLQILGNQDYSLEITDADSNQVTFPHLLNNGDFLTANMVFSPQTPGQHSDMLLVLTDDAVAPNVSVEVTGRGVMGDIVVDPSPVALGRVRVNEHSEASVSITNSGGAALNISGISLQGTSEEWSISSEDVSLPDLQSNPFELASGESINILLGFDPVDQGVEQGTLLIDNSTEEPQRQVQLSAEGYIPASVVTTPPGTTPDEPIVIQFGNVQLDFGQSISEKVTQTIYILNVGGEPLNIDSIERTGTGLDFSFEPSSIPPIDVGIEVPLDISFEPTNLGVQTASINVDTSDPDIEIDGVTGRFRIDMQANGIDPNIFITPLSKDFGDVYVDRWVEQEFSIQNSGFGPLTIESIDLSPGSSASYTLQEIPALPLVIANASMQVLFKVRYQPTSDGRDDGALEIVSSDIGNPDVVVSLTGAGAGCPTNQIDCDGDPQNGCETPCIPSGAERCNYMDDDCDCEIDEDYDLDNDPSNCGSCGHECSYDHAQAGCIDGSCHLLTCITNWADCNSWDGDGCEINKSDDLSNCGDCGNRCSFDNASALCLDGNCIMGDCEGTFRDCNFSNSDGCEIDTGSDPDNCSACGHRCLFENAVGRCLGSTCDLDHCIDGYQNCNFIDADGCEINLQNDVNNCGWCGHVCPNSGGFPICVDGVCGISGCQTGFADCDSNPGDCETSITNDPDNCGACNQVCSLANATAKCVDQVCEVDTCSDGWGNCNNQDADGCETDVTSSTDNCAFCGNSCSFDNAQASCVNSMCVLGTCDPGYYDVDSNPTNGCECSEDNVSNLCDDSTIWDLGILSDGAIVNITGNLIPDDLASNRDEDWYTFTAPDNNVEDVSSGRDLYHVNISFDPGGGNPDNMFGFDIYRNENTSAGCTEKGEPVCSWADVEYDYHSGQDPCWNSTETPGPNLCRNDTSRYWIRVYRTGALVNCSNYIINISFTQ